MAGPASIESLQALLRDSTENLLATLRQIEVERSRNAALRGHVAQLRLQAHGGQPVADVPAPVELLDSEDQHSTSPTLPTTSSSYDSVEGTLVSVLQAVDSVVVTLVKDDGSKVPATLIIGPDLLEVVESRARIPCAELAEPLATAPVPSASKTFGSKQTLGTSSITRKQSSSNSVGGLFCCFAPPAALGDDAYGSGQAGFTDLSTAGEGRSGRRGQTQGAGTSGRGGGEGTAWLAKWGPGRSAHKTLVFQAGAKTFSVLNMLTQQWLGTAEHSLVAPYDAPQWSVLAPTLLQASGQMLQIQGEASQLLAGTQWQALAGALPPLERLRPWRLAYSTARHGTSLATLYRRAGAMPVPTLLLVRDGSGYVFGCYTANSWHVAPRFYGSGETFVFQLEPHRFMYPWHSTLPTKNDYFQNATPEFMAVGGLGKYAIHVDADLLQGTSGLCGTFGSPCLAGREDFRVAMLEVWQAV